jgi:CRP-like cAMP-binding protein
MRTSVSWRPTCYRINEYRLFFTSAMHRLTQPKRNTSIVTILYDDISSIEFFSGLSGNDLQRIAVRLKKCVFLSGMVIMTRDAPLAELYVILSGTARVELQDDSGRIFNLTELNSGDLIGERAVLTDEPRTANVRAVTEVQAARLSRRDFKELLHETPLLYANLCRKLAHQLGSWAERHQREEREHREVITNVIGWQLLPEFGEFPGRSPWVRTLNERLDREPGKT